MTATLSTISKQAANYRPATDPARSCATCVMFLAAERACTLVRGKIKPSDTCDRWEAPVAKFRDDQLRDDQGRWAFEGGGGTRQAVEVTDRVTGISGVAATTAAAEADRDARVGRVLAERQNPPMDADTVAPHRAAQMRQEHPGHAVTDAMRQQMQTAVQRVAQRDGFDPAIVTVFDRAPVLSVGDSIGLGQGAYNPATGKIALFLDHSTVAENEGALTHEAQHARYDVVERAFHKELKAARAASDLSVEHRSDDFGALKPGTDAKYPTYAALYPFMGSHNAHAQVMRDDGISKYSANYWRMAIAGHGVDGVLASDETLAEVARVRSYGKPAERKALRGRTFLNAYYDAVQQQHARLTSRA